DGGAGTRRPPARRRLRRRRQEGGVNRRELPLKPRPDPLKLLNALPQPLLALDGSGAIIEVNTAAENFFDMGRAALTRSTLQDLLPFGSPVYWNLLRTQRLSPSLHEKIQGRCGHKQQT